MATSNGMRAADLAAAINVQLAELRQRDEEMFRASAEAFARAGECGASDVAITAACQEVADRSGYSRAALIDCYTSNAATGYHRRTGLIMRLSGSLPDGVSARDVQALVRRVPASAVDRLIASRVTLLEAYEQLLAWTGRKSQPLPRGRARV